MAVSRHTMDKPLSSRTVEQFIRKHAKSLELPKGVTPHTMRHCFACHALEDGVSHTFIQQLLGHRSASSTDVYLKLGIREMIETVKQIEKMVAAYCALQRSVLRSKTAAMHYQRSYQIERSRSIL